MSDKGYFKVESKLNSMICLPENCKKFKYFKLNTFK